MPLLTSREVILAIVESTYNVDATPTAGSNAMLVSNPSWSHEGLRMNERNVVKNTNAAEQSVFGDSLKTITFDVEIKGSGAAGTAPEFGVLFKGCGYTETVSASTSVTYAPSSTYSTTIGSSDHKPLTIYYYQDGLLHKITGARGTFSCNLETGSIGMFSFTFTGHSTTPTDAALVDPTLQATVPEAVKGATFTIDSFSAIIGSLQFDAGITVMTPPSINGTDGYGEIMICKRDLNGSFDPQAELEGTEAYYANFRSGSQMAMTTGTIGSAGNQYQIDMDKTYYRDISPGDRDGIRTYEIPFGCVETTGDDEISIVFT